MKSWIIERTIPFQIKFLFYYLRFYHCDLSKRVYLISLEFLKWDHLKKHTFFIFSKLLNGEISLRFYYTAKSRNLIWCTKTPIAYRHKHVKFSPMIIFKIHWFLFELSRHDYGLKKLKSYIIYTLPITQIDPSPKEAVYMLVYIYIFIFISWNEFHL